MSRPIYAMKCVRYALALGLALVAVGAGRRLGRGPEGVPTQPVPLSDPDFASTPVGTVPEGAEVNVERQAGDWYKVEYQGKTGWLNRQAFPPPRRAPNSVWAGC